MPSQGAIDLSEFASAVEAAGIGEAHLRALFDAGDRDGNGVLDLPECARVPPLLPSPLPPLPPSPSPPPPLSPPLSPLHHTLESVRPPFPHSGVKRAACVCDVQLSSFWRHARLSLGRWSGSSRVQRRSGRGMSRNACPRSSKTLVPSAPPPAAAHAPRSHTCGTR